MAKFEIDAEGVEKAIDKFIKGGKKRSVICLITDKKQFYAKAPFKLSDEHFELLEMLMAPLIEDRELFNVFMRLVEPVRRYYAREDRRKRKSEQNNK